MSADAVGDEPTRGLAVFVKPCLRVRGRWFIGVSSRSRRSPGDGRQLGDAMPGSARKAAFVGSEGECARLRYSPRPPGQRAWWWQ